jgi:hypothetical protein
MNPPDPTPSLAAQLLSRWQAPLGANIVRVEIYGEEPTSDEDFIDLIELIRLIQKQHQRARQPNKDL